MARNKRPRSTSPIADELIEAALAQGWRVESRRGGHLVFYPIDKAMDPIFTASTPSDPRGPRNLRSQLRRAGLEL